MARHFLSLFDLSAAEAHALIERALKRKQQGRQTGPAPLSGRILGLLFQKPSLRTRMSFEAAMAQLGGSSIFLNSVDVGLGVRETVSDFARVTSQYVDALAVRTFAQSTIEDLARHADVPVINALSDSYHPCQAMADMLTIRELKGRLDGVRLVFVGDGNNVARSLALASALLGLDFTLACPDGYAFPEDFVQAFEAAFPGRPLQVEADAKQAVRGADVVYTDVWASMGQEAEAELRRAAFAAYRVDAALMKRANRDASFLHCLPAHRGEEVTAEVMDGPRSQIVPQAANRLHFQKELLVWLIEEQGKPIGADRRPRATGRSR